MSSLARCVPLIAAGLFFPVAAAFDDNSPSVNYMLHCQGCHLPGGIGHPGIVPNMRNQVGLFLRSNAGRAYLVQVPGAAQSSLDDAALAAVINWMLAEFDPVNVKPNFKKFTAAEVAAYRPISIIKLSETRRALLAGEN